jgi:hypothetical protein
VAPTRRGGRLTPRDSYRNGNGDGDSAVPVLRVSGSWRLSNALLPGCIHNVAVGNGGFSHESQSSNESRYADGMDQCLQPKELLNFQDRLAK